MSAPSAAPSHHLTAGYAVIPNSLIENQAHLTRAELSLALIVLRRGGAADSVQVSDRNWQGWTGLSRRLKEYAVSGLKTKGLQIQGRGESARYRWQRQEWEHFVRHSERTKPRTIGRVQSVTPKAGSKIHPACRDNGCAMMAENAQPVARCKGNQQPTPVAETKISLVTAISDAQPVAQTATLAWAETLAALRGFFPLIGLAFLMRLLTVVKNTYHDIQDQEVAAAVRVAYEQKRRQQKSEGLFLVTVPEAIAALRKLPVVPSQAGEERFGQSALAAMIERVLTAVQARGAPFAEAAGALRELASGLSASGDSPGDLDALDARLEALEGKIMQAAITTLTAGETGSIRECVEAQLIGSKASRNMSAEQLERLRSQLLKREVLGMLSIPRLGLYWL